MTYLTETIYNAALGAVAMGLARQETRDGILEQWPNVTGLNEILDAALIDALAQGIEREDIDPSWLADYDLAESA